MFGGHRVVSVTRSASGVVADVLLNAASGDALALIIDGGVGLGHGSGIDAADVVSIERLLNATGSNAHARFGEALLAGGSRLSLAHDLLAADGVLDAHGGGAIVGCEYGGAGSGDGDGSDQS